MRILLVSFFFPPYNAIGAVRAGKLARELLARGHEVQVLTGRGQNIPEGLPLEVPEDVVHRTAWLKLGRAPRRLLLRQKQRYESGNFRLPPLASWILPDAQILWYPFAVAKGNRILANWPADLIYASAMPFTGLIVANRLSRLSRTPWVAELRDLWIDNHYIRRPVLRQRIEARLERRTLGRALGIVTVSDPLADTLRKKYTQPVTTILNGFDPQDFPTTRWDEWPQGLTITYTGIAYQDKQDPTPLFKAIRLLGPDAQYIRVRFIGRAFPDVILKAERERVAERIQVEPTVPFRQSAELQRNADILLLLLWNQPSETGIYTGKLFEYLGASRPILAVGAETGVAADLIRARGAGLVSNDPQEIVEQLRSWLRQKRFTGAVADLRPESGSGLTRAEQFGILDTKLREWTQGNHQTTARKARILVIVPQLARGGTERHLIEVLPRLNRQRFDVSVLCSRAPGPLDESMVARGIHVDSPTKTLSPPLRIARTVAAIAKQRPDLVHFFLPEAYMIGGLASILLGVRPRVLSRRSLNLYQHDRPTIARLERWLHGRMDALLANSDATAQDLLAECAPRERVAVLRSGIDVEQFSQTKRIDARRRLRLDENEVAIICVANLYPYKGHLDLLAAFAYAKPRFESPWRLLLVGRDAGMRRKLEAKSRSLELESQITWLGELDNLQELLAGCDLSVLSSLQEGFPNSVIEALAAGLPVIATRAGGSAEAFVEHRHGLLVQPRDPEALGEAILRLANDPDSRKAMGQRAAQYAAAEYAIEPCVRRYEAVYDSLLSGRRAVLRKIVDQAHRTERVREARIA